MKTKQDRKASAELGHALLEFVIVSMLIFLIPLATVECSRLLKLKQVATVLSKELATSVYRDCVADNAAFPTPRTAPPVSRFDPRTCVNGVVEGEFRTKINSLFPGCANGNASCPKLTLSLFGSDPNGTEVERDFFMTDDPADPEFKRFDRDIVRDDAMSQSSSDMGQALKEYRVLVIGQVRLPYSTPGVGAGFLVSLFIDRVYGVTIV
ncbi:MAG: hypothetical protein U0136_16700 [Bdellovibrionota bacterium]